MKKYSFQLSTNWVKSQSKGFKQLFNFWRKRWRSLFVRVIEKVLNGPSISNVTIQDISSLSRNRDAMKLVTRIELLEPAQLTSRNFQGDDSRFPQIQDYRRPIFRYQFSNVYANIESGVALVCEGFVSEEFFSGGSSGINGAGTILHEYVEAKNAKKFISGTWLLAPLPRFYFHFVAQELPALIRSSLIGEVNGVISSNSLQRWAKEAIEGIGLPVVYEEKENVIIENLVSTSIPLVISKNDVDLLRNYFPSRNPHSTHLAFVGRGGRYRNLGIIEEELREFVLQNRGSVVEPENLSWQEEIDFFAGCERLILIYGSSSANLVWMRPGAKVLILGDFSRYSTQIEKSLWVSSGVEFKEIDVSGKTRVDNQLRATINAFLE